MSGESSFELTSFLISLITALLIIINVHYLSSEPRLNAIKKRRAGKSDWKMPLRLWMMLRIVPAFAYLAYYHLRVQKDFNTFENVLLATCLILMCIPLLFLRIRVDIIDEYTRAMINKATSISLRLWYSFCILVIIPLILERIVISGIVAGYLIVGGIVIDVIVRSIAFWVLDRRGTM